MFSLMSLKFFCRNLSFINILLTFLQVSVFITMAKYDPEALPDLLPLYYKRLFPYSPYYRWLNYGGGMMI